jgi:SagB-type dehydrogenase family enzyme
VYCTVLTLTIVVTAIALAAVADEPRPTASPGPRFHEETGFDDAGAVGENLRFGDSLPLYKVYEGAPTIGLADSGILRADLSEALRARQSTRRFAPDSLAFSDLSRLVRKSGGLTETRNGVTHRTVPSAGALYPVEIYVVARRVERLASGIYHFRPRDSLLELVQAGDFGPDLFRAANEQPAARDPAAALILSARFDRSTHKYADRGYRYTYMEAGAACQNVYLLAAALGLGTVAIGAFNDEAANELLGLDGRAEAVLLMMPVGRVAEP